jgi:hypothetical protein
MRALDALTALAFVAGCTEQSMRKRNPHEGEHSLIFHNLAGGSVCGVFVFRVADDSPGVNRIVSNGELGSGDTLELWLVPGDYQVRATGCSDKKLDVRGYTTNVRLNMNGTIVLYREDDATSKAEATRLAHENENTYLVLAKVQAIKHPAPRTPKELDSEKPPL